MEANGKIYIIHDNGYEPFKVKIFKDIDRIELYKQKNEQNDDDMVLYDRFKIINNYQKIFVPKDREYGYDGNSILIELSDNLYMYVGSEIYTFKTEEKITKYHSPIGNSDVPYPYAISTSFVYLMLEHVYFDRDLTADHDPYGVYYGHIKKVPKIDKDNVYRINIKKIVHRRT